MRDLRTLMYLSHFLPVSHFFTGSIIELSIQAVNPQGQLVASSDTHPLFNTSFIASNSRWTCEALDKPSSLRQSGILCLCLWWQGALPSAAFSVKQNNLAGGESWEQNITRQHNHHVIFVLSLQIRLVNLTSLPYCTYGQRIRTN